MSLFPPCTFQLRFDDDALVAGKRCTGTVSVVLTEAVPRARLLQVSFTSTAWAGYGSGNARRVERVALMDDGFQHALPAGGLPAGKHDVRFAVHVPAAIAEAYVGKDCAIEHHAALRLHVEWALDPTVRIPLDIAFEPESRPVARTPLALQTASTFHPTIALEMRIDSTTVAQGEPVRGRIAIRAGHGESFSHVRVSIAHRASVAMARRDVRTTTVGALDLDATRLRRGETVAFRCATDALPCTRRTGALDLASELELELDPGLLSRTTRLSVPIRVLPRGSTLEGEEEPKLLGSARLTALASRLAAEAGLQAGVWPRLVQGSDGAVRFAVEDGSRGPSLEALVALDLPPLALGLRCRAAGPLVFGAQDTPSSLSGRYVVESAPANPHVDGAVTRAFLERLCDGLDSAREIQLSDARLAFRMPLGADSAGAWSEIVRVAQARAAVATEAIAALPFGTPGASELAWSDTAREEAAVLLRHHPAIVGISRTVRTLTGESRTFTASLWTDWTRRVPSTRLDVSFADTELPAGVADGAGPVERDELRAVRALLPEIEVSPSHLTGRAPGLTPDPRAVLPALDAVIRFVLELRGERRVDAPYR